MIVLLNCGGKLVCKREYWILVMCGSHKHQLVDTLVDHSYVDKLKLSQHFIFIDMSKSLVKSINILLTLKYKNKSINLQFYQLKKYNFNHNHLIIHKFS